MARVITALAAQKKNPERINVYLDGEYAFSLSRFVAAWLQAGQTVSEEKIASLLAEDEREAAIQQAVKFLNFRERSEAEVRANLEKHGLRGEVVEEALAKLRENGLVDDERFATSWVENRTEFHPRSRRALAFELRQKGIQAEAIERALASFDEDEMAYRAARKAAGRWANLEWKEFRQKVINLLARRGFGYETAAQAASRVWAEQSPDSNHHPHPSYIKR
ncbi:MAG: RecX family transcriptional regulator [Anaerolineales bacterium]|nr:RecX family transcriptional regulator [Anaerolineales bacterium]